MPIPFCKYQGAGNDFIVIDDRSERYRSELNPARVASLCDRRLGVGADGLILLSDSASHDFRMVYFNADGGEATFCGNGARCVVAFAKRAGVPGPEYRFQAADGVHVAMWQESMVRLRMGHPQVLHGWPVMIFGSIPVRRILCDLLERIWRTSMWNR